MIWQSWWLEATWSGLLGGLPCAFRTQDWSRNGSTGDPGRSQNHRQRGPPQLHWSSNVGFVGENWARYCRKSIAVGTDSLGIQHDMICIQLTSQSQWWMMMATFFKTWCGNWHKKHLRVQEAQSELPCPPMSCRRVLDMTRPLAWKKGKKMSLNMRWRCRPGVFHDLVRIFMEYLEYVGQIWRGLCLLKAFCRSIWEHLSCLDPFQTENSVSSEVRPPKRRMRCWFINPWQLYKMLQTQQIVLILVTVLSFYISCN